MLKTIAKVILWSVGGALCIVGAGFTGSKIGEAVGELQSKL